MKIFVTMQTIYHYQIISLPVWKHRKT